MKKILLIIIIAILPCNYNSNREVGIKEDTLKSWSIEQKERTIESLNTGDFIYSHLSK